MTVLFANNAKTTLAAALSTTSTNVALAAGTGALFPSIVAGSGDTFQMVFVDAATGLVTEIVTVTATSSDNFTVVRGQEGTTAKSWLTGDFVNGFITAASLTNINKTVTSIANLRAVLKTSCTNVFVTGYYAVGDGGGGHYWYDPTDTTSADNGGTVIVALDGGRWYRAGFNGSIASKVFGAKWDGATDDTYAHQAALSWLATQGGGTLVLDLGVSCISQQLTINTSGVSIRGQGRGAFHDSGPQDDAPTILKWIGSTNAANIMLLVSPAAGATRSLRGCSVDELMFNGNLAAGYGLQVWSCINSTWRISGADLLTTVIDTRIFSGLSEGSDVQQNDIWVSGFQKNTADGTIAKFECDAVGSGGQGNFSFNRVWEITGDYYIASGSPAVDVVGADNNDFMMIQMYRLPGGSGIGVRLIQSASGACRANNFHRCSPGAGGFYAAGTEAGSYPAVHNNITYYDTENGPPVPASGTGASLWWGSDWAPVGQRSPVTIGTNDNQITFNDGRIRYSGVTGNIAASGNQVITFPTAFPNGVLGCGITTTSGNQGHVGISTTGITVYNDGGGTAQFWWWAEGM